jgi:hypothetical protein
MPSASTRDARSLVVANWDAAPAETPGTVLRRTVPGRAGAAWWPGRARTARRTGPSQRRPQWSRLLLGLEAGPHAANQPAGSPLPLAVLARPSRARLRLQSERPRLARRTGGRARSAAASPTAPQRGPPLARRTLRVPSRSGHSPVRKRGSTDRRERSYSASVGGLCGCASRANTVLICRSGEARWSWCAGLRWLRAGRPVRSGGMLWIHGPFRRRQDRDGL